MTRLLALTVVLAVSLHVAGKALTQAAWDAVHYTQEK